MEKENKKIRDKERKQFNQQVRALVFFVKKRDPRWEEYVDQEKAKKAQKKATVMKKKKAQMAKKKAKMEEYQEAYEKEMEALDLEELGIDTTDTEQADKEELYCLVCKKNFRSKNQWFNHEKSKKHLEAVERVRVNLMFDDEELGSVVVEKENSASDNSEEKENSSNFDGDIVHDESGGEDNSPLDGSEEGEVLEADNIEEEIPDDAILEEIPAEEDTAISEEKSSEEEEIIMSSFRSKKNKKKQRKLQKRQQFNQFVASDVTLKEEEVKKESTLVTEVEEEIEVPQPVKKQKKGRRAKKNKNQNAQPGKPAAAPANKSDFNCITCGVDFPSRNKLFQHVKASGHAKPLK